MTLLLDIDLSRNRIGQDSSDEFDDLWRDVCGEYGVDISVQEECNSISGRPLAPVIGKEDLLILSQEVMRMEEEHPELAAGRGDDLQEPEARSSKPVSSRAERTDLLLIGGLLGLLKEKWKDATGTDISDAQVMDALEEWLPGVFKTRTTQDRFARARRALDNTE